MGIYTIFSHLKNAEAGAAELYLFMAQKISHKFPDVGMFLKNLSDEEKLHEKQVEMARNFFLEATDLFLQKEDAESMLLHVLNKTEETRRYFLENWDTLTPEQIIRMVTHLELEIENRHHSFYIESTDIGIKTLVDSLRGADRAHVEALNNFLDRYKD